jgi:hypothetical protein
MTKKNIINYDIYVPMHCQYELILMRVANTMVHVKTVHYAILHNTTLLYTTLHCSMLLLFYVTFRKQVKGTVCCHDKIRKSSDSDVLHVLGCVV